MRRWRQSAFKDGLLLGVRQRFDCGREESRTLRCSARVCLSARAALDKSGIIPKAPILSAISLAGARRHREKEFLGFIALSGE